MKRGIKVTYVSVEPYYHFRYLDKQAFRFNQHEGKAKGWLRASVDL